MRKCEIFHPFSLPMSKIQMGQLLFFMFHKHLHHLQPLYLRLQFFRKKVQAAWTIYYLFTLIAISQKLIIIRKKDIKYYSQKRKCTNYYLSCCHLMAKDIKLFPEAQAMHSWNLSAPHFAASGRKKKLISSYENKRFHSHSCVFT